MLKTIKNTKLFKLNQSGIAHLLYPILGVVVVALIAGAGFYVYQQNKSGAAGKIYKYTFNVSAYYASSCKDSGTVDIPQDEKCYVQRLSPGGVKKSYADLLVSAAPLQPAGPNRPIEINCGTSKGKQRVYYGRTTNLGAIRSVTCFVNRDIGAKSLYFKLEGARTLEYSCNSKGTPTGKDITHGVKTCVAHGQFDVPAQSNKFTLGTWRKDK